VAVYLTEQYDSGMQGLSKYTECQLFVI